MRIVAKLELEENKFGCACLKKTTGRKTRQKTRRKMNDGVGLGIVREEVYAELYRQLRSRPPTRKGAMDEVKTYLRKHSEAVKRSAGLDLDLEAEFVPWTKKVRIHGYIYDSGRFDISVDEWLVLPKGLVDKLKASSIRLFSTQGYRTVAIHEIAAPIHRSCGSLVEAVKVIPSNVEEWLKRNNHKACPAFSCALTGDPFVVAEELDSICGDWGVGREM
jgi:hypothetical protein